MNGRAVLALLGSIWVILAASLLAPLAVALATAHPHWDEVVGFVSAGAVAASLGWVTRSLYRGQERNIGRREGFAVVTFGWLSAVGIGMMPFLLTGTFGLTDAFFEVMSGFTTTGATVLGSPDRPVESLSRGLQFWRCMTQWLGGMGIVVLSVAILTFLGHGGLRLVKAEAPGGVVFEKDRPRISEVAASLWKLYLGISALEVVALLLAGTGLYDALTHTFTTMSTGGFSPHGESVAYFGPAVQWIIVFFMFVAGMNFGIHAQLLRGRPRILLRDPEFRAYLLLTLALGLLAALLLPAKQPVATRVRDGLFQVVSIGTTTGYATADFDRWPQILRLGLVALMFVGGCMGSTGGGMKVARMLVYAKVLARELHRLVYPSAVRPIRLGHKVLDEKLVSNLLTFGGVYLGVFFLGTAAMAAAGYDLVTSASASAASIGNIGPGLAKVGPMASFGHIPAPVKWVLALEMLAGRLEVFSVLVLLTPWAWKK